MTQDDNKHPEPESAEPVESVEPATDVMEEAAASEEDPTVENQENSGTEPSDADRKEEESYRDQYLRLRADFENFRKRTRREKEEWTQRCLENLCSDLLTVLDHFDLGIENSKDKELTPDMIKGFELVRTQLGTTLGKYGLSPIAAEEGAFDPNLHEAITHLPSPEIPEGQIAAMTRKGYQLGNRLLRPAQVVVSAGPAEEESTTSENEREKS